MEKANRIVYFDYLRVFATFAVMILHISAQNWYSTPVNSFEWQVFNFFNSAVRWCVPIFVMISGTLFLGKKIPLKAIYSKYILRLCISFIIWSAIYAYFFDGSLIDKFFVFVRGHYHMWFIFMMIGLYMCIPITKLLLCNQNVSKYYLFLALLFAFIIPEAITLVTDFGSPLLITAASNIDKNISDMKIHVILGYTSYFVFGYYLNKISLSKRQRMAIYLLGLGGFVATAVLDSIVALKMQTPCSHYYGYFTANVLLEATAIFVWFKYKQYHSERTLAVIQNLSKYSFGAYLVHALILEQLRIRFGLDAMSFNPILSILCLSIIVFAESYSISAILNNIPFLRKYMV